MKNVIQGVYFLYQKDEGCVYVGQSNDILRRIGDHNKTDKVFDSFEYIEINDKEERNKKESFYIKLIKPKYNIMQNDFCDVDFEEYAPGLSNHLIECTNEIQDLLNYVPKEKFIRCFGVSDSIIESFLFDANIKSKWNGHEWLLSWDDILPHLNNLNKMREKLKEEQRTINTKILNEIFKH